MEAPPSYLDYVQGLLGDGLSKSNAKTVAKLSDTDLADLRERNLAAGYQPFHAHMGVCRLGR